MQKIHGTSFAAQNLSSNIEYYTVFCAATNAVTDPDNVTGVDIKVTGNINDISQKNFEILLQSIGLRAMPVIMNEPVATIALDLMGAPTLGGEGYVWKFAVEIGGIFSTYPNGVENGVGLLVSEINGIVLPSSQQIYTSGPSLNVEFVKHVGL